MPASPVGDLTSLFWFGVDVRYPDFLFDDIKLILEIDGREHHGSREAFEADRRRQNQLVEAGWTILRFTATQVTSEPSEIVSLSATNCRADAIRRVNRPETAARRETDCFWFTRRLRWPGLLRDDQRGRALVEGLAAEERGLP